MNREITGAFWVLSSLSDGPEAISFDKKLLERLAIDSLDSQELGLGEDWESYYSIDFIDFWEYDYS